MALDLLIRKKQHKCCAAKHSMYFLIGELSSFNTWWLKGLLPYTDAGLFLWEFRAFCSTFLLNFFNIPFLLISLLSFWLYFSQCWTVWTFLSSPLTALVCCSFFPCSYLLYLEWNLLLWRSFKKISLRSFVPVLFDHPLCLALLTYFCLLLPCAHHMPVTSYPSFSVLLLLGNALFSVLELIIHWWLFSFFWAWKSVMVEWPALVFFSNLIFVLLILFKSAVRVLQ